MAGQVLRAVHNGVGILTLDDPERRNALSVDLVHDIEATFNWLENDPDVGAVVVTGNGPAFCSGADLTQLGGSKREGLRQIYEGFLRVARSPLPTIAAVNGPAVGAGMNLALSCDLRIVGRKARFDTRFLELGIHPGGGHTWMLRRLAGSQTATAMVLFGEALDGEQAVDAGLAWRCVDDANLLREARALAERAASFPRELVRRTKITLAEMADISTHEAAVTRELDDQVWSMTQPEFTERLRDMKNKKAAAQTDRSEEPAVDDPGTGSALPPRV